MIDDVKFDKIELPFESNFDLSICHRQFSHFSHKMAPYNRYKWSDMGPGVKTPNCGVLTGIHMPRVIHP